MSRLSTIVASVSFVDYVLGIATLALMPTSPNCGDKVELTCTSMDCNVAFMFTKNDVTIYNHIGPANLSYVDKFYGIALSNTETRLTISNVQYSDAGSYSCDCRFDVSAARTTLQYQCKARTTVSAITSDKKLNITVDRLYPSPSNIWTVLDNPIIQLLGTYSCVSSPSLAFHYRCTWVSTASLPDGNHSYTITVTTGTHAAQVSGRFRIVTSASPSISNLVTVDNSPQVIRGVQDKPLTIQCVSRGGIPAPTLAWYRGNTSTSLLAQSSTSDSVQQSDGTYTVTLNYMFTPRRTDDMTTFLCRVFYPGVSAGSSLDPKPTSVLLYLDISTIIMPMGNITAVSGERNFALTCSASSKPPATFTWFKGNTVLTSGTGTLTDNSFSYVIPRVDRTDAGSYRCQAGNNVGVQDSDIVYLRIKYPPTVTVSTTNSPPYTVTCKAEGYPENYTYKDWIQVWPGYGPVATIPFTGTTLTLTDFTYEMSGVYMCSASNGVAVYGTDKDAINANGTLDAPVAPVLIDPPTSEIKTQIAGDVGKNVSTYIKYWSNVDDSVVRCYKRVGGSRVSVSRCSVEETETKVTLPVYNHMVSQTGQLATVTIPIRTRDDLGDYDVVVSNTKIGESVLKVFISPPGPPSAPTLTRVEHLPNGLVILLVTPGFHGGYSQTLVLQTSTDRGTWDNITSVNIGQNVQPTILTSNNIQISTAYYVRLFAFNIKGRSREYSETVNVTRKNEFDVQQQLETTAIIAITAAVTACVVLISTVLMLLCVCRSCPHRFERILLFLGCRVLRNNACLGGNTPSLNVWDHAKNQLAPSDIESKCTRSDASQNEPKTPYEALHQTELHSVYMELQ